MLSYVSVDLNTGRVLADLRNIVFSGAHKGTIGRYESTSASLPLDGAPSNWWAATRPLSTAIVCLDDDGQTPLQGWYIDDRDTSHGSGVQLSLMSIEGYLDRRDVGDVTYTNLGQNHIVKSVVEAFVKTGAKAGIPIRVQIDGADTNLRTITYRDDSDKSVLTVLSDLSAMLGGPEWTCEWENVNNLITPVLRTADRLGTPAPAGLGPAAWFNLPGDVTDAHLIESFKKDVGANDVMAVSSGTGDARPQSTHHTFTGDNRPTLEHRWTPSTSITQQQTLEDHAERGLQAMKRGSVALTITSNRQAAPKLNKDWRLGDDIGFDLTSPAWPKGLTGKARAIGWELTEKEITPILLVDPSILDALDTSGPLEDLEVTSLGRGDYLLEGSRVIPGDETWTITDPDMTDNTDGTWTLD
ncbi:hypothetical protein [Arthrobacter sp. NA-172]|uniref:hypothetical protein n=1 Tax=Arthrobacter sp. NA-172 TaxID=3367524 RepID=UPI003754A2C1